MILVKNKQRVMAFQANTGNVVTTSNNLTKKQVENMVKDYELAPSKEFDKRISEITKMK